MKRMPSVRLRLEQQAGMQFLSSDGDPLAQMWRLCCGFYKEDAIREAAASAAADGGFACSGKRFSKGMRMSFDMRPPVELVLVGQFFYGSSSMRKLHASVFYGCFNFLP